MSDGFSENSSSKGTLKAKTVTCTIARKLGVSRLSTMLVIRAIAILINPLQKCIKQLWSNFVKEKHRKPKLIQITFKAIRIVKVERRTLQGNKVKNKQKLKLHTNLLVSHKRNTQWHQEQSQQSKNPVTCLLLASLEE